jgi:pyruvate kinase
LRRTKIVATLGPASFDRDVMGKMIDAGLNIARLNFSHGSHKSHGETIDKVRELAKEKDKCVGILQDLCGPKIRLGILPDEGIKLKNGDSCILSSEISAEEGSIPVQYDHLAEDLTVGDRILLADGAMELAVKSINGKKVECTVLNGGVAYSKKGVNMPSTNLSIVAFTEKDKKDLLFGLEKGVDIVALSFVRDASDLEEIKSIITSSNNPPLLIAKIEKPQAVENLEEILDIVDGVMVARGDLGVEMPMYDVPVIQKEILEKARKAGKISITATQMLKSMVENYRPTRAECTDVANAMFDGTCAVMLSEETASGDFPVEAVQVMRNIAESTEKHIDYEKFRISDAHSTTISSAVGRSAAWLAKDLNAKAIIAYTQSGFTARSVAKFRPPCPILGLTPNPKTFNKLNIMWGVEPGVTGSFEHTRHMFEAAGKMAIEKGLAQKGDTIIITAGTPLGVKGSTNLIKVYQC